MQDLAPSTPGTRHFADVVIRIAVESDLAAMGSIFDTVLERGDTYVLEAGDDPGFCRSYWLGPGVRSFVAIHAGRVAGMYKLVPNQTGRGAHVANASFMVDPGMQGAGIGLRLGQHCLEQASLAGYLAMQFNFVVSTNERAVALWRKLGFAIAGTLPGAFRHAQLGYVDSYVMFRTLDAVDSGAVVAEQGSIVLAQTERLLVRTMTTADAPFYLELLNTPGWLDNIGDRNVHSLEDARAALERGPCLLQRTLGLSSYLLQRKSDGAAIGICGLFKRDGLPDVDIGYALLPDFSGQGYAYEAAAAVMAYARDTLGLSRLLGVVLPENVRSWQLLAKLGMVSQGTIAWAHKGESKLYCIDLRAEARRPG
jgi:RimJ/RimL family protein N-acetyltransferase